MFLQIIFTLSLNHLLVFAQEVPKSRNTNNATQDHHRNGMKTFFFIIYFYVKNNMCAYKLILKVDPNFYKHLTSIKMFSFLPLGFYFAIHKESKVRKLYACIKNVFRSKQMRNKRFQCPFN